MIHQSLDLHPFDTLGFFIPIDATAPTGGTLTVNGDKELFFNDATPSKVTGSASAPVFYISAGSTLTLHTGRADLELVAALGQSVFAGPGTVVITAGNIVAGGPVFSNTGGATIENGATVSMTGALSCGTGVSITNDGTLSTTAAFTVPVGTSLTLGATSSLDSTGVISVNGALVNNIPNLSEPSVQLTFSGSIVSTESMSFGSLALSTGATVTSNADITATTTLTNSGTITTTGALNAPNLSTNSGTINATGAITVSGTLANTGTIIPGSSVTGTITGNNYTVQFAVDPAHTTQADRTIYAANYANAALTLPAPTGAPAFARWFSISPLLGEVTGTTALSTVAISGGPAASNGGAYVRLAELQGTFATSTPTVGTSFTGFIPPAGGTSTSSYQWLDGSAPIGGALGAAYTPTSSQAGHLLSLAVTTTFPSGYSPASATVTRAFPATIGTFLSTAPLVSGLAASGSTLVADASASFTPGSGAVTLEWFRNTGGTWNPVSTGTTYLLTALDVGATVKVVATSALAGYVTATSETVAGPVAGKPVISVSTTAPNAGDTITISVPGLLANSDYSVELHSTPVVLGVLRTSAAGALSGTVTIPGAATAGVHTIVVYDGNGNPVTSVTITVSIWTALASTGVSVAVGTLGLGAFGLLLVGLVLLSRRRRPA